MTGQANNGKIVDDVREISIRKVYDLVIGVANSLFDLRVFE